MSAPTKLGALAASNLRSKRRSNNTRRSSEPDGRGSDVNVSIDTEAGDILEVSLDEGSEGSGGSGDAPGQQRVYSFFDPKDIRRPPTSPASQPGKVHQSADEPGGGDDASAATERIGNRKGAGAAAAATAGNARPPSSLTIVAEEREARYEDGATELFMLVEEAKWEEVCDR